MMPDLPTRRPWTFMVYMAGDNGRVFNAEAGPVKLMEEMTSAGYRDLAEMAQVGTTDRCAVTCLFDSLDGSFSIEVRKGRQLVDSIVEPLEQVNTGDPDTLARFVLASMAKYPADRYVLVIWNHGTGWIDLDPYQAVRTQAEGRSIHQPIFRSTLRLLSAGPMRGIALDDSSKDFLDAAGLRVALERVTTEGGRVLDVIGMDACLMAMIEGARELAPYARYFVASQEVEPMEGWPYHSILKALNEDPDMPTSALAEGIVREYARSYRVKTRSASETITQSAVDLSRTAETETLCRDLVQEILAHGTDATLRTVVAAARKLTLQFKDWSYCDLGDLARRVADLTRVSSHPEVSTAARRLYRHLVTRDPGSAVVRMTCGAAAYQDATGLSVYLPSQAQSAEQRRLGLALYQDLVFAKATGWDGLLQWYFADATSESQPLPESWLTQPGNQADAERTAGLSGIRPRGLPPIGLAAIAAQLESLVTRFEDRLTSEERSRWRQLHRTYVLSHDAGMFVRQVDALLGGYAAVRKILTGSRPLQETGTESGDDGRVAEDACGFDSASGRALVEGDLAAGEHLEFHVSLYLPETILSTQTDVPLLLRVAIPRSEDVAGKAKLAGPAGDLGDLTAVLYSDDLEITGGTGGEADPDSQAIRTLRLGSEDDAQSLAFFLRAGKLGRKRLVVDLYCGERRRLSLAAETEVVAPGRSISHLSSVVDRWGSLEPAMGIAGGAPSALELRVLLSADSRSLSYTLRSLGQGSYNFMPAGRVQLPVDPRSLLASVVNRLRSPAGPIASHADADDKCPVSAELADVGRMLYRELFSPELKRAYRHIRANAANVGRALVIVSDEVCIPWELVKPFEMDARGSVMYDDPPLCASFLLSRWLPGQAPPNRLRVRRGACVVPHGSSAATCDEATYFEELHRRNWQIEMAIPLRTTAEVEAELARGDAGLLHFACPGALTDADADASLRILGRALLRHNGTAGSDRTNSFKASPLVFLNWGVGMAVQEPQCAGDWAQYFIGAGAGAFIGSHWQVDDRPAALFAREFYERLWGRDRQAGSLTLGEALHDARQAVYAADPSGPAWLAYTLYGDPYARVRLG